MKKQSMWSAVRPYLIITFGMLIYAFAATGFLVPHKIVGGGATGISTVLFYLFGIPVGVGYFLVNIILLIIAMKVLGPKFGVKTIFAIAVGSLFLGIMQPLMPVDGILPDEKFMSTIIAAMLTGVGIGLSITVGGSTGGTDIIAMLVTKYHNVSPGRVLMVADFCVIAMTLLIYDPLDREAFGGLIYGYVMMGIVSFTVDYVLTGKTQSAQLFIFSEKYDEIARELTNQVHRGVTLIDAKGWYSGQEKKIIMIVARKYEASEVLRIARQIDVNVFMTMAPVMGVFGKGFEEVKGIK
mgnify:CR=1 FL=1